LHSAEYTNVSGASVRGGRLAKTAFGPLHQDYDIANTPPISRGKGVDYFNLYN
jgi:hypothetical protein